MPSLIEPRVRTLEERHAQLEQRIAAEDARPLPDTKELTRLKQKKLKLKDEMQRLRQAH
jgi:hypothetical protein